jgi:transcriptional regulator with XRE-family HTH domain
VRVLFLEWQSGRPWLPVRPSNPQEVARRLGRRIAELRADHGWTQEDFAESLGVSVQYLRRIELAKTNLTIPRVVELANALHVRVPVLFESPRSMAVKRGRPKTNKKG